MLTKVQIAEAKNAIDEFLCNHYGKTVDEATNQELYFALANYANQKNYENKGKSFSPANKNRKTLHYMSIEFLPGRSLKTNLWNLSLEGVFRDYLYSANKNIDEVYEVEVDAGLGNGGLGRLASCYLDSLAKLGYNAFGHSIKYRFGLFKQKIENCKQVELPDPWLDTGSVWLEERIDQAVEVKVGGNLIQHYSEPRGLSYTLEKETAIKAVPFDMQIGAYNSTTVSTLRLWEARAKNGLDLKLFDMGEFGNAMESFINISEINIVLYPSDSNENGKTLRLLQQYFLVSASMQNMVNNYLKNHSDLKELPFYIAVQLNDTHPALCIPELMRILIDEHEFGWDDAWNVVTNTISYTNHTILSEALEVKKLHIIEKLMPRIALILKEIDRRFRIKLCEYFKNDTKKIESLAVISGDNVFMANLSVCASNKVNGVAKIHSQILRTKLFKDYTFLYPDKFINITNGISHRRWLSQSNPLLDGLIVSLIGDKYYDLPEELSKLADFADDSNVLKKIGEIKFENKKKFANYIEETQGIKINPHWRFDVQVKRIHEYKRQLLNVLKIIYICDELKKDPSKDITPEVFIFAGKAASGYKMAKRIIEIINLLAKEIDEDPVLSSKLKILFVENFNVSVSELLMPATEVSEQISLAGREASGTGNMKAVINGALMLCTIDGANIEICDRCGRENMFEFGMTTDDVQQISTRGYNAMDYYIQSEKVRIVVDKFSTGIAGEDCKDMVDYLLGHSNYRDTYMCLADFDAYIEAYEKMDSVYRNQEMWNKRCLESISAMGYFSSDRSIKEYVSKIWNLSKNEE